MLYISQHYTAAVFQTTLTFINYLETAAVPGPNKPHSTVFGGGCESSKAREDLPRFIATDGARTAKSP
jgi:hypothetical protein